MKVYYDIDDNEVTLRQMIRDEPEWAAVRIQQAERYEEAMKLWYDQEQQRKYFRLDGNSPGHGHPISGVWDSDNGAIAGHECGQCILWNMVKGMFAEKPQQVAAS